MSHFWPDFFFQTAPKENTNIKLYPYTSADVATVISGLPSTLSLPGAMSMHEVFVRQDGTVRSKKLSDAGGYDLVHLKLSCVGRNRGLEEVEVEEEDMDDNQ